MFNVMENVFNGRLMYSVCSTYTGTSTLTKESLYIVSVLVIYWYCIPFMLWISPFSMFAEVSRYADATAKVVAKCKVSNLFATSTYLSTGI